MSLPLDAISEVETDDNILELVSDKKIHKEQASHCCWRGRSVKEVQPPKDALVKSWHIGGPMTRSNNTNPDPV